MNLWTEYRQYDSTEQLLYGLAAVFTLWFALALAMRAKKKSAFREWGEAGFTAVWLALGIRILLVEAYSIPSESMVPTLLIKDHLLVSKTTFGWHLPYTQRRVFKFRDVKRGEIVIFVPPHQPKLSYVKRCVGLPGDQVQVIAKRVYINGQLTEVPFSYGRLQALAPASLEPLDAQRRAYQAMRVPQIEDLRRHGRDAEANMESYRTTWLGPFELPPNGTYYLEAAAVFVRAYGRLLDAPAPGTFELLPKDFKAPKPGPGAAQPDWTADHELGNRDYFGPYTLKPGEYWMMGDNRDNSSDSRYFGPVSEVALRGTPLLRYWPLDRAGLVH